jgi:hypothetical protein
MSTTLFIYKTTSRVTRLKWSDDWYTLSPWSIGKVIQSYYSTDVYQASDNITIKTVCIGPLAIITGKLKEVQHDI